MGVPPRIREVGLGGGCDSSRPSRPLLITTMLVVAVGALLPFTGLAAPLGFVPLTGTFYVFVAAATLIYLLLVQVAKAVLLGHAEDAGEAERQPG